MPLGCDAQGFKRGQNSQAPLAIVKNGVFLHRLTGEHGFFVSVKSSGQLCSEMLSLSNNKTKRCEDGEEEPR